MENKLGVYNDKLNLIERKIVNLKLNLLDEYVTFNQEKYDLNYLLNLNKFLFGDIYFDEDIGFRTINDKELKALEIYLDELSKLCIVGETMVDDILDIITEIWNLQPFLYGNTRTLLAFLKIINSSFLLNLDIDVNTEINSSPRIFQNNKTVNPKRLT